MARVDRGRGDHPRGPRRAHRPRRSSSGSSRRTPTGRCKIGSFSAASNVTGILSELERDLACCSTRTARCRSGTSPPPRRTSRSRWTRRADPLATTRTRCSSRPTSSSAGRARPGSSSPGASCSRTGARRARRRHGRSTSTRSSTCTSSDIEHREEGGTPAIVESIRAGLVFQLKAAVGVDGDPRARGVVHPTGRIDALGGQPRDRDPGHPRGGPAVDRVLRRAPPAASTCTTTSSWRCSTTCSGSSRAAAARVPGRTATGCSGSTSRPRHGFEREIARGCEGIKPGWVRVNFNYFISEAVFEFILDAVDLVATRGLAAAPGLRVRPRRAASGATRRAGRSRPSSLHDIRYDDGRMAYPSHRHREPESAPRRVPRRGPRVLARPAARRSTGRPIDPARWPATSRTCAGSCCPRTSLARRRAAARVSERGPGAPGGPGAGPRYDRGEGGARRARRHAPRARPGGDPHVPRPRRTR